MLSEKKLDVEGQKLILKGKTGWMRKKIMKRRDMLKYNIF